MKKSKERAKGFVIGFAVAAVLSVTTAIIASTDIGIDSSREISFDMNVMVNGNLMEFSEDARPFIMDGRSFLPARSFADFFGIDVGWNPNTSTLYLGRRPIDVDALHGRWRPVRIEETFGGSVWYEYLGGEEGYYLVFLPDGVVVQYDGGEQSYGERWWIEDALLHIDDGWDILIMEVEIYNNNMILTYDDWGATVRLHLVRVAN